MLRKLNQHTSDSESFSKGSIHFEVEHTDDKELVKERLPLTKWELTPKEKEDFDRVMRLMFDAANILRYDLELGEDAIGKTLKELADWATN